MGFKPQPMYEKLRALQRGETSSRGTAPLRSARSAYNTGRTPNLGSLPSPFRRSYCPKKRVGKAHQIHVMWCSSGRCGGGETGPKGRRALASRKQFSSSFCGVWAPSSTRSSFRLILSLKARAQSAPLPVLSMIFWPSSATIHALSRVHLQKLSRAHPGWRAIQAL